MPASHLPASHLPASGPAEAFAAALRIEADTLSAYLDTPALWGAAVEAAVALLAAARPPVLLVGLGKSGHVARKLAATWTSTGTPALFLHAAEALHGDLGLAQAGQAAVLFSHSGGTAEVVRVAEVLTRRGLRTVAVTAGTASPLARLAEVVIPAPVGREADPLDTAPTASTTLQQAIGDGLAAALMRARGFTLAEFHANHPGGSLGTALAATVAEAMLPLAAAAVVDGRQTLLDARRAAREAACPVIAVLAGDGGWLGLLASAAVEAAVAAGQVMTPCGEAAILSAGLPRPRTTDRLAEARRRLADSGGAPALPVDGTDGRPAGLLLPTAEKPGAAGERPPPAAPMAAAERPSKR